MEVYESAPWSSNQVTAEFTVYPVSPGAGAWPQVLEVGTEVMVQPLRPGRGVVVLSVAGWGGTFMVTEVAAAPNLRDELLDPLRGGMGTLAQRP